MRHSAPIFQSPSITPKRCRVRIIFFRVSNLHFNVYVQLACSWRCSNRSIREGRHPRFICAIWLISTPLCTSSSSVPQFHPVPIDKENKSEIKAGTSKWDIAVWIIAAYNFIQLTKYWDHLLSLLHSLVMASLTVPSEQISTSKSPSYTRPDLDVNEGRNYFYLHGMVASKHCSSLAWFWFLFVYVACFVVLVSSWFRLRCFFARFEHSLLCSGDSAWNKDSILFR